MRNWTIRRRILLGLVVLVALLGVVTGAAHSRLVQIRKEATQVQTQLIPGMYYGSQLIAAHYLNYSLTQAYVLHEDATGKQKHLADIRANQVVLRDTTAAYEATVRTTKGRDLFDAVKRSQETFLVIQAEILKSNPDSRSNREAAQKLTSVLDPEFERFQTLLQRAVKEGKDRADAEIGQILGTVAAEWDILLTAVAAIIFALVGGYFLLKAITRPLADLGSQLEQSGLRVHTSVAEIGATGKQQQVMATEVATTALEIGATSKEISATAKELVRTMGDVSRVADESAALAAGGQAGLGHMEATMRQVIAAGDSVTTKLAVLNDKASNIGQVVTTITKVADQTNLLSLNAAIEAEKAGEYGRGFAVVATEIRRLADQTAVASYDIEQMVKEIQSAVSAGVMSMDKFSDEVRRGMQAIEQIGAQLSQIIQQVQALAPRVESVNEGMQAQTTGAEQISEALTQLSSAAQHTVESLRQSSQAIDDLQQVSRGLSDDVSRFKSRVA